MSIPIRKGYGEHPPIKLESGTTISGQIFDANGKPLAEVVVQGNGSDSVYTGFPNPMARVKTDAEGRYSLPPMKLPVDVRVAPFGYVGGWSISGRGPTEDLAFLPILFKPTQDGPLAMATLDFHPAETVTLTALIYGENGHPAARCAIAIFGEVPDLQRTENQRGPFWRGRFSEVPTQPGLFQIKAPKGLLNATLVDAEVPTGPRQEWSRSVREGEKIDGPRTDAGWSVLDRDDDSIVVGEPADHHAELPFVSLDDSRLLSAAELNIDVSNVDDPAELLRQLEHGPRVSQVLTTGSGIFWHSGAPPQPNNVDMWEQRFAVDANVDPRVRRLTELGDVARQAVHRRLLTTRPVVVGHLAVVLRSVGDESSIPLLIQLLEKLGKTNHEMVMETPELMATFAATSVLWELTGQKHVFTPQQWQQWWDGVKDGYVVARNRKLPRLTEQRAAELAENLIANLRQNELPARDRLIAQGPAMIPYLLSALRDEPLQLPSQVSLQSSRLMSIKLAWVIDELGATERLSTDARLAYFTDRLAQVWKTSQGSEPSDELAVCRALSVCSFADFCRVLLDVERMNDDAQPTPEMGLQLWMNMNSIIFSRRFQQQPGFVFNPTQHPFWNDVTPAKNPAQEIAVALPVLIAALKDEKPSVRLRAAMIAQTIGLCSDQRPELLIKSLHEGWSSEKEPNVRYELGFAMARLSTPFVVKAFSGGLRSDRSEIVSDSAGFLDWVKFELSDDTLIDFELLKTLTRSDDDKLRTRAMRTLADKAPDMLVSELPRLVKDPVEDIRNYLTYMRPSGAPIEFVDAMFVLTQDPRESIRRQAISAIGNLGDTKLMTRLQPLLKDKQVYGWAVSAIIDSGGQQALPLLMDELKSGNDVGGMIYQHLKRLTGQAFEDQPERWLAWWAENGTREEFKNAEQVRWIPTKPSKVVFVSSGSSKILEDASIQLDGSGKWQEFTLSFSKSELPARVQTVRLELLSPLPSQSQSGKSVKLFDVKPHLQDKDGKITQLEFAECQVVGNPDDDSAVNCIDFLSDTGWKVPDFSGPDSAHQLVLKFAESIVLDDGNMFGVTIDAGGSPELGTLSRVRVSFVDSMDRSNVNR